MPSERMAASEMSEKMGLPEKQQSEHLTADAELSALLETLDALERQATPGPWEADEYRHVENSAGHAIANFANVVHDGHKWRSDLPDLPWESNAKFVAALRNAYPLLRERLSAALLDNQRVRKEREELQKRLDEHLTVGPAGGPSTAHQWIPVSERLPENGEKVALLFKSELEGDIARTGMMIGRDRKMWHVSHAIMAGEPTHWMLLPESPV